MVETLKRRWHQFKECPPGERFQRLYTIRRRARSSRFQKVLLIGCGLLIMAAGIFFLPAPGPGMIILFLGATLLAQESLVAARILDWIELRGRKAAARGEDVWNRTSPVLRGFIALLALVLVGAVGYGALTFLSGGG